MYFRHLNSTSEKIPLFPNNMVSPVTSVQRCVFLLTKSSYVSKQSNFYGTFQHVSADHGLSRTITGENT